jgi:hypothetical protein
MQQWIATAQARCQPATWAQSWQIGSLLSFEQALSLAKSIAL